MRRPRACSNTCCLCFLAMIRAVAAQTMAPVPQPAAPECGLRIARSVDGLAFHDTGEILAPNTSAPALARLADGQLLAVVDYAIGSGEAMTALAVSGSRDEGKSWSRPRAIRFGHSGLPPARCAHGALATMPDGLVRLYFVAAGRGGDKRDAEDAPGIAILCAMMHDGLNWTLDPAVRIPLQGTADPYPVVVQAGSQIHLFVAEGRAGPKDGLQRFSSDDGRQFRAGPPLRSPDIQFARSVVRIDGGFRAYCSDADGVRPMTSSDGLAWKTQALVCLYGGHDPAVVQLRNGTWLMLYRSCSESRDQLTARGGPDGEETGLESNTPMVDEAQEGGRRVSATNLKGIAVACLAYSQANRGNLPPDLETLVKNSTVSENALISPLESSGYISYVYVSGQRNNMDPRNVIAYENPQNYRTEGTNVLFLDGHVEWMKGDAFEEALGDTKERLGQSGESANGK